MADILRTTAGLAGGSEVRRLLRECDWSDHPLGPPDAWPAELATAVTMAVSSSFPMFVAWGPELRFLYNDAYAVILGGKHPAAFGARFQDIWYEIWPDLAPIIERALSNQSSYHENLPLTMERHGYREQTWFTFSYSPLHDAEGRVAGMYCTVIETTERVHAERRAAIELAVADALRPLASAEDAIRTAARLLGEQMGLARVLYADVDVDRGTFTVAGDWSAAGAAAMTGHTFRLDLFGPQVVAAGRAGDVVAVADVSADPRTAPHAVAYAALDITSCLLVPLQRDGRLAAFLGLGRAGAHRWVDAEIALARGVAGRVGSSVDLARVQATLRAERDRSQTIFDTTAEGFMLLDSGWRVVQINAEGLRLADMREDQVLGRSHWELWPEAVDSEAGRMYRRVMRERTGGAAEYVQDLPRRGKTWMEVRAYPTRDGGMVTFFRDITKRKRTEKQLRDADRRKDEFLAMLAHELRNPLAPISAAADLLRIGRLDEARVRQSSAIIARQVRHMTSLVDDLLDVSRVTRGQVTLARAPVTARTIVDEAIEQVRPMFDARRQILDIDLSAPDAAVLGDRARLVQVLANLLGNASKYTPEARRIGVRAAIDAAPGGNERLVLSVQDEGIGMEGELTAHVFDLFTQAQRSSDRAQGGLGLGLALVKHLVELHGGSVSCSSPGPGLGSTFVVALPLTQPVASPDDAAACGTASAAPAAPQGLRVLLVDDNIDAAATLGMLLEACGHRVLVENSSLAALARLGHLDADELPQVALLDIGLPDMDGNELARRLRADPHTSGMALVAVTGYGQDQDRRAALEAGFDQHLVKPVDMAKLAGLLAEVASNGGTTQRHPRAGGDDVRAQG